MNKRIPLRKKQSGSYERGYEYTLPIDGHLDTHLVDEYTLSQGPEIRPFQDFHGVVANIAQTKAAIHILRELRREKALRNPGESLQSDKTS